MTYPVQGPDLSIWDDDNSTAVQYNFQKTVAAGAPFVIVKSSQSTWMDQDLLYNWSSARNFSLLRGAYHYMTYDAAAISQADYMWSLLRNDPGELDLVIDYECRTNNPGRATSLNYLKTFGERLIAITGNIPMIYTSPGFWAEFGSSDLYWQKYKLWLANYTTIDPATGQLKPPTIPAPWRQWLFWQFTDKADGLKYGSEAKEIDMNYWYGSLEQLYAYAGKQPPTPSWEQSMDAWARQPTWSPYTGPRP